MRKRGRGKGVGTAVKRLFRKHRVIGVLAVVIAFSLIGGGAYASFGGAPRQSSGGDIELQKGLVGWWKMDGNAKDATPNADDGTVTDATSTTDREGRVNSAYSFNGSTASITTPNSAPLSIISDMTISVWVNVTNDSSYSPIISKNSVAEYEIGADFRSGATGISWRSTNSGTSTNLANFFNGYTNTWVLVTARVVGTNVLMYRNGIYFGTMAVGTRSATSNGLSFGRRTTNYMTGSMDDVRIYNRPLSTQEVTALYQTYDSAPKLASGEKGLKGWWKMDGNAKDATPNGFNGVVSGATLAADRKGKANSAYSFNGSSNYISMPTMNIPTSVSVSAWVYSANFSQTGFIVGKNPVNTQWELFLKVA